MGLVANYVWNLWALLRGREPTRPLLFSYYVTHRCNLACRYCCDGDGKRFKEEPIPELTTDEAKELISILSRSADTLDITGGEPMLRSDLEELLEHAQAVGMRTVLNTKAIGLVGRADILRFSDVLVLSIDTLEVNKLAELFGRPCAVAHQVIESLEFALAKHRGTGTKLVLSAVATPTNLADVAELLPFAARRGLGFHVSPEIVGTHAHPKLRANSAYAHLIEEVLGWKRRSRGVLGVPEYIRGIRDFRRFHCHPLLMPVIRPDGRLYYPCLESKHAEVSILEAGGYEEALHHSRARHGEIPECGDCCHLFCHMGISLLQRHPLSALGELRHWRK